MFTPINKDFSKKYGNNRWSSYSIKLQRDVHLSSNLEYDNWLSVECDPYIINFCEQPFEIKQVIDEKICSSIPDMWILYADGTEEIREVKYERDIREVRVQRQIKTQQTYCKDKGIVHRVITDKDIRSNQNLLSNYKTLVMILKNHSSYDFSIHDSLINLINFNALSIENIALKLSIPVNQLIPNVAFLLFNGTISADLNRNFFGKKLEVYKND